MAGALDGIRIVDLTAVVMGPYATRILADYGADVVKVEPPHGDTSRQTPPMRNPGMGAFYLPLNRNKRSVVLDLKQTTGMEALFALLDDADVFITNMRPKALAKLGLSTEVITARYPRLVIVSLVGFGQNGRYAGYATYDDLIQGLAAVPSMLLDAGSDKLHYVPVAVADRTVGVHAAVATLAAILDRDRTGEGQIIEVPMFEVVIDQVLGDHIGGRAFHPPIAPPGYQRLLNAERRPYETKDGAICLLVYSNKDWKVFSELVGDPNLMQVDPRFATTASRTDNSAIVGQYVAKRMLEKTTAEWLTILREAGLPVAPLHTLESIFEDPHLNDVEFFKNVPHNSEGTICQMSIPTQWSKTKPEIRRQAPQLGEHSLEILREAKIPETVIENMLATGATRQC